MIEAPRPARSVAPSRGRSRRSSSESTFGIEEELFVVRIDNGALVHELPAALVERWQSRFAGLVGVELLQAQVELRTPICHELAQAKDVLSMLRRGANEEAVAFGLALLSAGTHPVADWRSVQTDASPRHAQLVDSYRVLARRNAVCGLHVHVAIPAGVDRIGVMNRIVPWTPLLLALSASSPFWRGEDTGLASYRQSAYDEWPRSGTPPLLADDGAYAAYVARLVASGCIADPRSIWWTMRPSALYPTLELRITDACPELDDTLSIAALYRCLVRAALAGDAIAFDRDLVEENRWRAKRGGTAAILLHPLGGEAVTVPDLAEWLLRSLRPHAVALDCEAELAHVNAICASGNAAERQLAVFATARAAGYDAREALRHVVDDLLLRTEGSPSESWHCHGEPPR